jgi:hypothetical protein
MVSLRALAYCECATLFARNRTHHILANVACRDTNERTQSEFLKPRPACCDGRNLLLTLTGRSAKSLVILSVRSRADLRFMTVLYPTIHNGIFEYQLMHTLYCTVLVHVVFSTCHGPTSAYSSTNSRNIRWWSSSKQNVMISQSLPT